MDLAKDSGFACGGGGHRRKSGLDLWRTGKARARETASENSRTDRNMEIKVLERRCERMLAGEAVVEGRNERHESLFGCGIYTEFEIEVSAQGSKIITVT